MSTTTPRVLTLLASGDEMAEAIGRLLEEGIIELCREPNCDHAACEAFMAASMWVCDRIDTKSPAAESVLTAGRN